MKKILCFLLLSICTKGFSLCGGFGYCPNFQACPEDRSGFDLSAEWLYMLSSIDQPFFALEEDSDELPFGKRFANEQRWHSGYRIEARYFIPCSSSGDFVKVRWTHFPCFTDKRTRGFRDVRFGAILIHSNDRISGFGMADIRDRFHFHNLEFLLGRALYCCCDLSLGLEFGVQWTRVTFHERAIYVATGEVTDEVVTATVKNRSTFNGFGPEAALDFSYCLTNCFSLRGRSAFAFLVNKRQSRFDEVFFDSSTDPSTTVYSSDNDRYWLGNPFFNVKVGINYHSLLSLFGCYRWPFDIEVGYEIIHMIKSVDRIYFNDSNNEAASFVQNQDFTLHGPYIRAGIFF